MPTWVMEKRADQTDELICQLFYGHCPSELKTTQIKGGKSKI